MGNNASAPMNNGSKPANNATKNSSLTNAAAAAPPAAEPESAPAATNSAQAGGRRRRGHKRSHRRRRTHRRYRGGAGLTLRYPKGRAFTPTGPSFGMNNPAFSPSASRRSSVVSMSNNNMQAYSDLDTTSTTLNDYEPRASFGPSTVRRNRKNRKSRKNRKNRKSRSRRN